MAGSHTFVFADLAGFTALTEVHGDEYAADLATDFCATLGTLLPDDAEDFKSLGDSCLVRVPSAGDAVRFGVRLAELTAGLHGHPSVRVGMHTGPAVQRGRDWFGTTVNIASRVVALAGPGDVLLTSTTSAEAGEIAEVKLQDCGQHELRNVASPVHVLRAQSERRKPRRGNEWVVDPVCRMSLDAGRSSTSVQHAGREVFFCSPLCAGQFVRAPERYLRDSLA